MTELRKVLFAGAFVTAIRGLKGFLLFHVKDHVEEIYDELWAMLAERNAIVVEIDNSRVHVNGGPA
ncbi:MAG: hypothetical protein WBW99_02360 [Pseudolabrys sp.]